MKVYVLISWIYYESSDIVGVYSSKEKAELVKNIKDSERRIDPAIGEYVIEEWDVE